MYYNAADRYESLYFRSEVRLSLIQPLVASCKANNEIVVFCRITNNSKIKADKNVYVLFINLNSQYKIC